MADSPSSSGGTLFEVRFDLDRSNGDLIARSVASDGGTAADVVDERTGEITVFKGIWRARQTVDAKAGRGGNRDTRIIITSGFDGRDQTGRRFSWDHHNGGLFNGEGGTEDLKKLVDPGADPWTVRNSHSRILNWVRGGDDHEGTGPDQLRRRNHVFGNIIHSAPQYVRAPFQLYTDNGYADFRTQYANRDAMVYVGSNDGMLHGFNAADGTEVFAYVPRAILPALAGLTVPAPGQIYTVDATPTIADAYGNFPNCDGSPCWRSVLVSGLNNGGRSVFALDVTDPVTDAATEQDAAGRLFLWEFTDPDLGETWARPVIERLADGTWVAIFGNGRNAGGAALFVVDIATGALVQKLNLSGGSGNGLSSPAPWDSNFDGHVDHIYAGDLDGNLWKLDFTAATATGNATVAFSGHPLIRLTDPTTGNGLPITVKPQVGVTQPGQVMVYVGTGFNDQDRRDANGFFGIEDRGSAHDDRPSLTVHTLDPVLFAPHDLEQPSRKFRVIGNTDVPADDSRSWQIKLTRGEQVLNDPILNNERIAFTTVDCSAGRSNQNWFVAVDFETGQAPALPFLDVDGSGDFDHDDFFSNIDGDTGKPAPAIGRFLGAGVVSAPVSANITGGRDTVFITRGLGGCDQFNEEPPAPNEPGDYQESASDSGATGSGVTVQVTGDKALTENIDVTQSRAVAGRVSWRERL